MKGDGKKAIPKIAILHLQFYVQYSVKLDEATPTCQEFSEFSLYMDTQYIVIVRIYLQKPASARRCHFRIHHQKSPWILAEQNSDKLIDTTRPMEHNLCEYLQNDTRQLSDFLMKSSARNRLIKQSTLTFEKTSQTEMIQ